MQGAFLIDTYILKQIIDYEAIVLSNVSIVDCFNAARRGLRGNVVPGYRIFAHACAKSQLAILAFFAAGCR